MKKVYTKPEMELETFEIEDIMASGTEEGGLD